MGEQRIEESEEEPRLGVGEPEATPRSDEPGGDPPGPPSVIDLRSAPAPASSSTDSPPEARRRGGWRREGSGLRLRLGATSGPEVDVHLPAVFGSEQGPGIAVARTVEQGDRNVLWTPSTDRLARYGPSDPIEATDDEVASSVSHHLAVHTLEPAGWPTSLARAVDLVEISRPTPISPRASVGELLSIQLQDQCAELLAHEGGVRAGVGDSVHHMRVASRRLRSLLATYRPWLRGNRAERVRRELRELAERLGRARDTEVLHLRLDQEIAALPEELVVGPVLARVARQLHARQAAAFEVIWTHLDDERYQLMVDHLGRLAGDPPLAPQARRRARAVLAGRVVEDGRRVRRAHAGYARAKDSPRSEVLLHEVRKSAKRARYAAEAAEPVLGKPAARMARRMQKVQEVLGENQDSVAARLLIRHLVFQAHLSGENCFTFGLVYGMEMARASEARAAAEPAIRAALEASEQLRRR